MVKSLFTLYTTTAALALILSPTYCQLAKRFLGFNGTSADNTKLGQPWRLDNFNKDLFWEEPAEGLYEVDVGLRSGGGSNEGMLLQVFADLNNDKYTDMVAVNDARTAFTAHIYDPTRKIFNQEKSVKPGNGCIKITNVAVGRSIDRIRLFVTCNSVPTTQGRLTSIVTIFEKPPKSLDFIELTIVIPIEAGSQPFIGDLNGDYLEDILFSEAAEPHKLRVAF
jgi:hypothetical protein